MHEIATGGQTKRSSFLGNENGFMSDPNAYGSACVGLYQKGKQGV